MPIIYFFIENDPHCKLYSYSFHNMTGCQIRRYAKTYLNLVTEFSPKLIICFNLFNTSIFNIIIFKKKKQTVYILSGHFRTEIVVVVSLWCKKRGKFTNTKLVTWPYFSGHNIFACIWGLNM